MNYGLVSPISVYCKHYADVKEKGSINIDWFEENDNLECRVPTNRWLILYTGRSRSEYIVQRLEFHYVPK